MTQDYGLLIQSGIFLIAVWALVHNFKTHNEKKISRIYERIDEVKTAGDEKHVTKEICAILQERLSKDIDEIKTDVKILLRMTNNEKRSHK